MHRTLAPLLALLLAAPTLADEFAVRGPDLAGRATIDRAAGTYQVEGVTFGKRKVKDRFAFTGELVRTDDDAVLGLGYTETSRRINGFTQWLRLDFVETVEVQRVARFDATASGAWRGTLGDLELTLVPQPDLDDLSVLVVPGLSTNLWNQNGVPYLDENMATLEARGLRARRLEINTEQSVAVNAARIGDEIRLEVDAGRRVLLIAHSKGGADTITALSDPKNADLLPHVAGLIAIQPVYGGSRVADFVADGTPIEQLLHRACGDSLNDALRGSLQKGVDLAFGKLLPRINRVDATGSPDAVRDLQTDRRQDALARHPYPVGQVPTVVVRGFFRDRDLLTPRHVLRGPLVALQLYTLAQTGEDGDGMVTLGMQSIPGAVEEVTLADIDHFEPGFRGESPHTPVAITHQGLELMLPHLKAAPARRPAGPRTVDLRLGD